MDESDASVLFWLQKLSYYVLFLECNKNRTLNFWKKACYSQQFEEVLQISIVAADSVYDQLTVLFAM